MNWDNREGMMGRGVSYRYSHYDECEQQGCWMEIQKAELDGGYKHELYRSPGRITIP